MSNVDAAWLRIERPENTADVVALLAFRVLPDFQRLRGLVEERLLANPRFRQRALTRLLGGGFWEEDPAFDLDAHLVRNKIETRSPRPLQSLVGEIASVPLAPSRPLWRLHHVEQPEGGAIVAKVSHCVADGFALVGLLLSLAGQTKGSPERMRFLPAARRLAPWLELGATARAAMTEPTRALALLKEAADLASASGRIIALPGERETALQRPLTGHRRTAWSRGFPLARIREAARGCGGTTNDVLVAATTAALRHYLETTGEAIDEFDVRALVPVNLRPLPPWDGVGALGNRFGLAFVDLPTRARSTEERLEAVRAQHAALRRRPDAIATWMLLAAMGASPFAGVASRFFSRKASLVITSLPGPREHLTLLDQRIEHVLFWVPHPATLGLGVSILSYAGEVRIGVRADVAVMPDPAGFVRRLEAELRIIGQRRNQPQVDRQGRRGAAHGPGAFANRRKA
ncbi:MAG TPA: WS/DGAT domain-containing protein [Anaeromyxobacteraceae bacterium]|nr:WS/DGAT domain-containing protein [Anaeromyxobacteraceae bacterium]